MKGDREVDKNLLRTIVCIYRYRMNVAAFMFFPVIPRAVSS